jgi:KRAB domain-containing zinc finger protein
MKSHQGIDTGDRPFSCNECGKSFSRQNSRRIYQSIHAGEWPCYCNKSFSQQVYMKRHQHILGNGHFPVMCVMNHPVSSGEQRFSCNI